MSQPSGTIESTEKKPQKTGGLAGITAGQTAISTVGKEGKGLTYRGYSIEELASQASFEEVAFLLLIGTNLVAEAAHVHIPKGYVYFAMAFSVFVEVELGGKFVLKKRVLM